MLRVEPVDRVAGRVGEVDQAVAHRHAARCDVRPEVEGGDVVQPPRAGRRHRDDQGRGCQQRSYKTRNSLHWWASRWKFREPALRPGPLGDIGNETLEERGKV